MTGHFRDKDLREAPFIAVMLVAAAGLLYSALRHEHWLRGIGVVGVALLGAAILRTILTDRQSGLLVVRNKFFDAFCYAALGIAILAVGAALPH